MGIVGRAIDGGGSGAATNPSSALKKPSRRQGATRCTHDATRV